MRDGRLYAILAGRRERDTYRRAATMMHASHRNDTYASFQRVGHLNFPGASRHHCNGMSRVSYHHFGDTCMRRQSISRDAIISSALRYSSFSTVNAARHANR